MNLTWLIVGILLGLGAAFLWGRRSTIMSIDWLLIVLWLALALFTVAITTTMIAEIYAGAGRAAGISVFVFGGLTVLYGVFLYRRIFTLRAS